MCTRIGTFPLDGRCIARIFMEKGIRVDAISLVYFADQIDVGNFLTGKKTYQSFKIINSKKDEYLIGIGGMKVPCLPRTMTGRDFIWIIPISQTNGRNLSGRAIFLPVYSQRIPIGSM